MIAFVDREPVINVSDGEYRRLLGYPRNAPMDDRARELDRMTRDWYARHGRPWIAAQEVDGIAACGTGVEIAGTVFTAERLRQRVEAASATSVVIVAVSAGAEAEAEAARLWKEEKPDEYYFLEMYASAVVEYLVMAAGGRLCAVADARQMAVLPHDSPGYVGWDVAEQPALLSLFSPGTFGDRQIEALPTGMLRPKKSLLAVFGLTPHVDRVRRLTQLVPCDDCPLAGCQFRRRPFTRGADWTGLDGIDSGDSLPATVVSPLSASPRYSVKAKALARWAAERLTLTRESDGSTRASFRFDGTTCSNMGRPIALDYEVTLGPREAGYAIERQRCGPTPGDTGHTAMCRYLTHREELMQAIATEAPLGGRPIDDVLTWGRPQVSTGCLCDADSRNHKWGLVLETIHYALAGLERRPKAEETGT
jgi:hypothetical protein